MEFSKLPLNVQSDVKSTLNAYDSTTVYQKEDGSFYNITAAVLHTGAYDKIVGVYKATKIFTKEERVLNYVRTFRDYPFHAGGIHYAGKKDYFKLSGDWTDVTLIDGEIIFT